MSEPRKIQVEVMFSEETGWHLAYILPSFPIHSTHATLLDAVIAREFAMNGVAPPFHRWFIDGVEEVQPVGNAGVATPPEDGEAPRCLYLRRWEYEEILLEAGRQDE